MLPVASLRLVQIRLARNWMTSWASFVDGLWFLQSFWPMGRGSNLLEFSFHFRDVLPRVRRLLLVALLSLLCAMLFLSVRNLSCRLSFLLNLDSLLDLNLHLIFFSSACFCVTPFHTSSVLCCCSFSTRQLSIPQFQSPLQSQLGVLLLTRQPSILALLQCVDDLQYPCLSSSVQLTSSRHCSPRCSWHCSFCSFDSLLLLAVLFSPAVGCALLAALLSICSA